MLDDQKHRVMKANILADFDSITNYRIVLSTATLTSGVDCSKLHFHRGIHYHQRSTGVADLAQAIMRVRHVHAKHHKVYYDQAHCYKPIAAQHHIHADLINDAASNLKASAS